MRSAISTILVAGGAGFIGSHFIRRLLRSRRLRAVINFDKLTYSGNPENVRDCRRDPRYRFVRGDIADPAAVRRVFNRVKPDVVVNFAAETHVDRSIHGDAKAFVRTNIEGVRVLLEEARRAGGIAKFVQVSTDEVYGELPLGSCRQFTEASPLRPRSPYAASKAAGDLLALSWATTFGLPVVVTRSGNNFGPNQYPEKLIPFFIARTREGKPLPLYGDGKHVRDWIFVEDHCRALDLCMRSGAPGEVYNIGAGNQRSNREIAERILAFFKADASRIAYVADRPGHDRRYAIDASKIRRAFGWMPAAPFEQAFERTVAWYASHPEWIASGRKRAGKINAHII